MSDTLLWDNSHMGHYTAVTVIDGHDVELDIRRITSSRFTLRVWYGGVKTPITGTWSTLKTAKAEAWNLCRDVRIGRRTFH